MKWSGPLRRSIRFATERAEIEHKSKDGKARMLRLLWDHNMHGGNSRKMGLSTGVCNLCQQPDSAKHWISECQDTAVVASRAATAALVEQHLSTLGTSDPKVTHFVKTLALCTTRHEEGYMHKIGMIPHERLAEIGMQIGLHTVTETQRGLLHDEALKLGIILMDGVLTDYLIKSGKDKEATDKQLADIQLQRKLKRATALRIAMEKRKKRKEKPRVPKQTRMTDYANLVTRAYGAEQMDPHVFGTEDHRRMDAGIG